MGTSAFVEHLAVFMTFVHEAAVAIVIAAYLARWIGDALARRGFRRPGLLSHAASVCLFATLGAGLFLLGSVMNDGWYLIAALLCALLVGTTSVRAVRAYRVTPTERYERAVAAMEAGENAADDGRPER